MVKDIIAKLSKSTEPAIRTSVGDNEFGLYEGDIVALLPLSTPAIVGRLLSARGTDCPSNAPPRVRGPHARRGRLGR